MINTIMLPLKRGKCIKKLSGGLMLSTQSLGHKEENVVLAPWALTGFIRSLLFVIFVFNYLNYLIFG